ncbi:hypothetical protein [Desulfobacter hydrogenophilus]|uniref:hypothetical protein n=1 Tax=Desulfobacter hydrogenophilus TaxID=2291 RepID=UPI0013D0E199|nr:hypothetical protein [Desulfobacter hydrogenophilus]NDY71135.1 hypothetical protein [Desulfobacter hydrogenophilus]
MQKRRSASRTLPTGAIRLKKYSAADKPTLASSTSSQITDKALLAFFENIREPSLRS